MNTSLPISELEIPNFLPIEDKLKCKTCFNENCEYSVGRFLCSGHPNSKYDCEKFLRIISISKMIFEIILFSLVTVFSFINFKGFWLTLLTIVLTFIFLLASDILSDKLIKYICIRSEEQRKHNYSIKVEKLKEENEAIKRVKDGITEEIKEFLDTSKFLSNELHATFESIKDKLNIDLKIEKRVVDKFQEVLKELEILNGKLSKHNFESTYISTLYELHLPKLLEYSKQFLSYRNSNTLTQKQIAEFSNLLEVFKVKISDHTKYLQNRIEDDFVIKMKALNEDVMPDFDGSEVENNE